MYGKCPHSHQFYILDVLEKKKKELYGGVGVFIMSVLWMNI